MNNYYQIEGIDLMSVWLFFKNDLRSESHMLLKLWKTEGWAAG